MWMGYKHNLYGYINTIYNTYKTNTYKTNIYKKLIHIKLIHIKN